jgi:hypothetical protein
MESDREDKALFIYLNYVVLSSMFFLKNGVVAIDFEQDPRPFASSIAAQLNRKNFETPDAWLEEIRQKLARACKDDAAKRVCLQDPLESMIHSRRDSIIKAIRFLDYDGESYDDLCLRVHNILQRLSQL